MSLARSVALVTGGLLVGALGGGLAARSIGADRVAEMGAALDAARRDAEAHRRDAEARREAFDAAQVARRGDGAAFAAAVSAELERSGHLCLAWERWPVETTGGGFETGRVVGLRALERIGLVRSVEGEAEVPGFGSRATRVRVVRHGLTEEGRRYARPHAFYPQGGEEGLCYARHVLEEVVDWEGPMELGGYAEARVRYRYRVEATAPWADDPGVRQAFPEAARATAARTLQDGTMVLKRTANGWSARGLGG